MVAYVLVQQIVADDAEREFARLAEARILDLLRVADLGFQQIIAVGRCLVRRNVVLRKGVQQRPDL